jgi:outer membrane protein assembly factor BamE (lipoprotein component of BamABCDE complex)
MKVGLLKVSLIAAAAALAGCAAQHAHKGMVLDQQLVASIQPGVDNKASVEKLLGRPSFAGEFTPNEWYYVSRDTAQLGFRNPRATKVTVLRVRFDPKGNVLGIDRTGKELVMNVNPSKRETPTLGRKRSFWEELFGGIGSVGSGGLPGGGGGGGTSGP